MEDRIESGRAGIEAIRVWLPHHYLLHDDLAIDTGVDPEKYRKGLGCTSMAVLHPMQDAVTMAAEAGVRLLEAYLVDPGSVGQLIVATESGVDWAKPVAAYVHDMLGLGPRCRTYDVQHACFAASAALASAVAWSSSGMAGGRSTLVIATDIARYEEGTPGEATQGAGAVAMLVDSGGRAAVLRPDYGRHALHARHVMDFWRPAHMSTAIVDGKYSVRCYLEALASTYRCHRMQGGAGIDEMDYMLFHLPFPRMAEKALHVIMEAEEGGLQPDESLLGEVYAAKVLPGVRASQCVGNIYTGSLYLGLASLLETEADRSVGATIGFFSYGSGSCAEYFTAAVGPSADAWRGRTGLGFPSSLRMRIGMDTYRSFRNEALRLGGDGSFRLGHLPCADSIPTDARFVFLGYRHSRRVYAPGPAGRREETCADLTRLVRQPAGPAS